MEVPELKNIMTENLYLVDKLTDTKKQKCRTVENNQTKIQRKKKDRNYRKQGDIEELEMV